MAIFLLAYVATFLRPLYFRRNYFFTLLQSDHFGKTEELLFQISSAQHQLFQKSYVLEKANFSKKEIFCMTYFFWRAAVLEQLLFQMTLPSMAATFSEMLLVHNILFRKSYYFTDRFPFHSSTSYLSFGN